MRRRRLLPHDERDLTWREVIISAVLFLIVAGLVVVFLGR